MSLKDQTTRGLKWQATELIGRQLLSLVIFASMSRLLEPKMIGLFGLVSVYLFFIGMFSTQGISSALIQRKNLEPEHLDTAFWYNFGCAAALCLLTIALANPVSNLLGVPELAPYLRWSSLTMVINAASTIHSTICIRNMDFRRPALRLICANFTGGVVGVGMALTGFEVWSLVGQQIAVSISSAIFLWTVSDYRPKARFSKRHFKELRNVSSSVFATSLLWFFSSRLDQMIIGRFIGVPILGMYVIAGKLPDFARMVTHQPVSQVTLPALSKLQHDHRRMCQAIYSGMELTAAVSFAIYVGLAVTTTEVVPLFFGAKWQMAAELCSLISLYTLVNTLQVFFHPALLASGGAGKYLLLNVWHALGVLAASVIGIYYGIQVLVFGLIVNGIVVAFLALLFLRKRIGLSPAKYCGACVMPLLASTFMAAVVFAVARIMPHGTPVVIVLSTKVLTGAAAYIGFTYVFGRSSFQRLADILAGQLRSFKLKSRNPSIPSPTVSP